ncbi:hypothetical protein D3C76_1236310 [compost metagenome]
MAKKLVEHHQFVLAALIQVGDAEVLRPSLDHRGFAPADDRGLHAGRHQHLDALAVERVEGLEFAAVFEEVQAPVGQDAVDIEHRQLDLFAALQQVSAHYITPARSKSCMFKAPTGRSSLSTTTSALIL